MPFRWWLLGGAAIVLTLLLLHVNSQSRDTQSLHAATPTNTPTTTQPANAIELIAEQVSAVLRQSRPVLLGSRDPQGPSCVTPVNIGDIKQMPPSNPGDYNGGPGTTFATLYGLDRQNNRSAMSDFAWHQRRLKTYLENLASTNQAALEASEALTKLTSDLAASLEKSDRLPDELQSIGTTDESNWISFCQTALERAVAAKDLGQARHWSKELSIAAFSLEDLHRWLAFLSKDYLTALAFQNQCRTLFEEAEALKAPHDPNSSISNFPAGVLCLNGFGNFYEVERQAERMFTMPADRLAEVATNQNLTTGSQWVRPGVRATFLKLQSSLSPANQRTFEEGARTPFEHSYLINMLYRAKNADTTDYLCAVLKKFDATHPNASVGELMGVLMYRGHSFAGLEWADRYQPELLQAAADISPSLSDAEAFAQSVKWTNQFYKPELYGVTFTLRDALRQNRLDCVRATDMIGAIYRNAGRAGFGNVRWCSPTRGHTVAAHLKSENGKLNVMLGDGLSGSDKLEQWPDCYFQSHAWPPGFENEAPPYAVELYIRGIDSYIWAEGYIIRGPNAGLSVVAGIPYSPTHTKSSTQKIFAGPYPK